MDAVIDGLGARVRSIMHLVAKGLNRITGGKLNPNAITMVGAAAHVLIAWWIATNHSFVVAGGLLIFFGLFDSLDGQLARLQHRATKTGMLLDSVADRIKEIVLYIGISTYFISYGRPVFAVWAVAALGSSLLISYLNAWGEVVTSGHQHTMNQAFRGGWLRFEVRMFLLVVGLFSGRLALVVVIITLLAAFTAGQRLLNILNQVRHVQN